MIRSVPSVIVSLVLSLAWGAPGLAQTSPGAASASAATASPLPATTAVPAGTPPFVADPARVAAGRSAFALAMNAYRAGAYARSESLLGSALVPGMSYGELYQTFAYLGVVRGDLKNYAGAVKAFGSALAVNPKSGIVSMLRGSARFSLGDTTGANADFQQAGRLDPSLVTHEASTSFALLKRRRFDDALHFATLAQRMAPSAILPKMAFCEIFFQGGNYKVAVDACGAVLASPNAPVFMRHEAYGNRSFARAVVKDYRQALDDANRALQLATQPLATDYYHRGYIEWDESKDREAIADLSRAIALEPKRADAHLILGASYQDAGDETHAKAEYALAIGLDPNAKRFVDPWVAMMDAPAPVAHENDAFHYDPNGFGAATSVMSSGAEAAAEASEAYSSQMSTDAVNFALSQP